MEKLSKSDKIPYMNKSRQLRQDYAIRVKKFILAHGTLNDIVLKKLATKGVRGRFICPEMIIHPKKETGHIVSEIPPSLRRRHPRHGPNCNK